MWPRVTAQRESSAGDLDDGSRDGVGSVSAGVRCAWRHSAAPERIGSSRLRLIPQYIGTLEKEQDFLVNALLLTMDTKYAASSQTVHRHYGHCY